MWRCVDLTVENPPGKLQQEMMLPDVKALCKGTSWVGKCSAQPGGFEIKSVPELVGVVEQILWCFGRARVPSAPMGDHPPP